MEPIQSLTETPKKKNLEKTEKKTSIQLFIGGIPLKTERSKPTLNFEFC